MLCCAMLPYAPDVEEWDLRKIRNGQARVFIKMLGLDEALEQIPAHVLGRGYPVTQAICHLSLAMGTIFL